MAVSTIRFTDAEGVAYNFEPETNPLVNRSIADVRIGADQGPSYRRINVTLSGFFLGNKSEEVMLQIDELIAMLASNQLQFYYHDGARVVVDSKVWISDYSDPSEWKQYSGSYTIQFYYFENSKNNILDHGIEVSYETLFASYLFSPPPAIARVYKPNRSDYKTYRSTPSGFALGETIAFTLEGFLRADTPANLSLQIEALEDAFSKDGILNYGSMSRYCYVGQLNIPSVFPVDHCNYSIELLYDNSAISEVDISRTFTRIHRYPKIVENIYCDTKRVTVFGNSGQEVAYEFRAAGKNRDDVRTLLANEAEAVVYPGGVELPGGTERWNDMKAEIQVSFRKYYQNPVLSNLPNT